MMGQTDQVINTGGGSTMTDGLKIKLKTTGGLCVYRNNHTQYYNNHLWPDDGGKNGVELSFRFDNGTTYNATKKNLTACSVTAVHEENGTFTTSISGYVESSIADNGVYPVFYITVAVTYTHPNKFFQVDYHVRAPNGLQQPQTVHLYLGHDSYILGHDGSKGYRKQDATGEFVGNYRNPTDAGACKGGSSSPTYPSAHGFKIAGTYRSYYSAIVNGEKTINTSDLKLTNTISTVCDDDAVAVEFTVGPLTAGVTEARRVLHCYGDVLSEFEALQVDNPDKVDVPSTPVTVDFISANFDEIRRNDTHVVENIKIRVSGGVLSRYQVVNFTCANKTAQQSKDYSYAKGFIIPEGDYTTPKEISIDNVNIIGYETCQSNQTFTVTIDPNSTCNDLILRGTTIYTTTVTIADDRNRLVIANDLTDKIFYPGQNIEAVALTSTPAGATFAWTNSNTSVGLAAKGTGDLPAFTAANNTKSPITATITVTPTLKCPGTPKTFTLTINPFPTITYNYNGGTAPATANPTTYKVGTAFSIDNEPTRPGYDFSGWTCAEINVSTPVKPLTVPATTAVDLNVYAHWGSVPYTITYVLNGGEVPPPNPNPATYDVETESFSLKNPERTGYIFTGWTSGQSTAPQTTVTIPKGSTGDLTFTANWQPISYPITYDLNDGTAGVPVNPAAYTIETESFTLTNPTRNGYTFGGWTGSNGTIPQTTVTIPKGSVGEKNYTAIWTTVYYTIDYDYNGGTPGNPVNPGGYSINTPTFTLTAPERNGYTFVGWSGAELTGNANLNVTIAVGSTGNRAYQAHWTPIAYPLTYMDDGNAISPPGAPTQYDDTQLPLSFSSTPEKEGYHFYCWSGIGAVWGRSEVNIPTGTLGALEYQAIWSSVNYTITFNANGGILPSIPNDWSSYALDNLPVSNISLTPTWLGYTFTGWTGHGLTNQTGSFSITDATPGVPGHLTYAAQWTLDTCNIRYNLGGGVEGSPANPTFYTVISPPITLSNPSRPGYEFKGWTGSNGEFPEPSVTIPTGSTGHKEYMAIWEVLTYKILFDVNSGDPLSVPVEWNHYDMDHLPVNNISLTPTRSGYTFDGWTGHGLSNQKAPFSVTETTNGVPGELHYQAQWILDTYSITYDYDGGSNVPNPPGYNVNTPEFTLNNPTKAGYTFVGWTGTNGTTPQIDITIPVGSTGNRTYTANWSTDDYLISYDYDGGTAPATSNKSSYNVGDTPFDINNQPTRAGYIFEGWTGSNGATPQPNVQVPAGTTGNLDYKANWTIISYTITYMLDGGTEDAPNPGNYDVESGQIILNNPLKTGYTFIGWTGSNGSTPQPTVVIPTGSVDNRTYTANWSENVYPITYNYAGGTPSATPNPTSYTISQTPFLINNDPSRTGYDFIGWVGSNGHTPQKLVTVPLDTIGELSYTAHWEPVDYTITYILNDGEVDNPEIYTIESAPISLTAPIRLGYTFTGWSGTGLSGNANLSVTIPTGSSGNRTYTAHWEAEGYTILFDPNGGVLPPNIPANWLHYDLEHLPTGINIQPTCAGYTFKGWSGHGIYGVTTPFNLVDTMPGIPGNLIFTAQWDLESYTITYELNDGISVPGNPVMYNVTELPLVISHPPVHLNPQYRFIGWSCPQLPDEPRQIAYTVPAGTFSDLTMIAQWSQKLDSLNGGTRDTLYACQAPKVLSGDPQALNWTWIHPDGTQQIARQIQANQSGRYICHTDYGSIVLSDTMYAYFANDVNTEISYLTTTGAKINKIQQFAIRLPQEILSKATTVWTVDGRGTILNASTDTLTVLWNTTGVKKVSAQIVLNYEGISCAQTLTTSVKITEQGLGFFVNQAVAGGNHDGSSWKNAYRTLQEALSHATPGDRIWVAAGTYQPDAPQGAFMTSQDSVEIYGGFAGTEEYLYERNPRLNPTILKGNGTHVVWLEGCIGMRLDGFTIQDGHAENGAGIYLSCGASGTIANCILKQNTATKRGGAIHSSSSWYGYDAPLVVNTEISGNQSVLGGGIFNERGNIQLLNVTISGNRAEQAGGFYNEAGQPDIFNSILWGNVATQGKESNTEVLNEDGIPYYIHSIIGGSKGSGGNWLGELGLDGGQNKDVNPGFIERGVDNDSVTLREGNYHLFASGEAVDAGSNTHVMLGVHTPWDVWLKEPKQSFTQGLPMDLDYRKRIADDDVVDIGAYEYNSGDLALPVIKREVILPAVEGVRTNPEAGSHYVDSRSDFVFSVFPSDEYATKRLVVTTSRVSIPDTEGVIINKNADGSYLVTIRHIQDRVEIYIDFESDDDGIQSPDGRQIWSYRNQLHVRTANALSELHIYTLSGQLYGQHTLTAGETVLQLPSGVYVVTLDQNGMKRKIIIR
jgi:uncharacterized repeat protein (TIGR02543 family)